MRAAGGLYRTVCVDRRPSSIARRSTLLRLDIRTACAILFALVVTRGARAVVCPAATDCASYVYDLESHTCIPSFNTGAPCNDGKACTFNDRCDSRGRCVGSAYSCATSCGPGQCDGTGGCLQPPCCSKCGLRGSDACL